MLRSSSRRHKRLARWLPCNDYSPRVAVLVVGATSAATASHDGYNDRHDDQTADDYTNDATSGEVHTICTCVIATAFAIATVRVVIANRTE